MSTDCVKEKYYAVRIGRKNGNIGVYFALYDLYVHLNIWTPALYNTQKEARSARREILSYCGHKDVFVVRVELKEVK